MTDRGDALISAITQTFHTIKHMERIEPAVAHAICEHLGITWEDVKAVREWTDEYPTMAPDLSDALATLLEAAGIDCN